MAGTCTATVAETGHNFTEIGWRVPLMAPGENK